MPRTSLADIDKRLEIMRRVGPPGADGATTGDFYALDVGYLRHLLKRRTKALEILANPESWRDKDGMAISVKVTDIAQAALKE